MFGCIIALERCDMKKWFKRAFKNTGEVVEFANTNKLAPGEIQILEVVPREEPQPSGVVWTMYYANKPL
ncbi:MAG: hypothetical protein A3G05_00760 [Candidatus Zambryskibacteria bacterium RIFCSPLOWO2_12_FULL_45_14]|uniref:Uncharacterized protein n=2 Tax=Candidatus Zambryskiibacteriota TaxID=1817925 RepID=A0A1G2UKC0_9BACT|nr:MAG: hypothetical protein A3H60_00430 [Candidatus Zambryskibacteria bacterium RIFCSPLOWO2_02_FULL_44_12b]OHB13767.1 MAG: hypothetical protein A3G05_00760 [Candidatus Zambryskibacteria bacterium RIFCSPLOWO2_12_FULL_45_14]